MAKKWCPLPWNGISVRNNGDVRVCCNANTSKGKGLMVTDDGNTRYSLPGIEINEFRNSTLLKDIRISMLHDVEHENCMRCYHEESVGLTSRRMQEIQLWQNQMSFDLVKDNTAADGTIDVNMLPLKFADLRFGNRCNLKCVMCGATDSDQWYSDHVHIWGKTEFDDAGRVIKLVKKSPDSDRYIADTSIYDWYENDKFWENLKESMSSLEHIYLVGGEPLLIDKHYTFLEECIRTGNAAHITMEYNSNITNIPNKVWSLWSEFKKVTIGCSIDGVGAINDYMRFPSKWCQIHANLEKLDNAKGNLKVWISATVTVYNMVQFPKLLRWAMEQNFSRINRHNIFNNPVINAHPLHTSKILNVKIFPAKSKKIIEQLYKKEIADITEYINSASHIGDKQLYIRKITEMLTSYINYMNSDDYSALLPQFWKYTNKMDELRNNSLRSACPTTWELLGGGTENDKP